MLQSRFEIGAGGVANLASVFVMRLFRDQCFQTCSVISWQRTLIACCVLRRRVYGHAAAPWTRERSVQAQLE